MVSARVRNAGSSLAAYFSRIALTDCASIRAWAGSYTPQGRSQWALTSTAGASRPMRMGGPFCPSPVMIATLPRREETTRAQVGAGPGARPVDAADAVGWRPAAGALRRCPARRRPGPRAAAQRRGWDGTIARGQAGRAPRARGVVGGARQPAGGRRQLG